MRFGSYSQTILKLPVIFQYRRWQNCWSSSFQFQFIIESQCHPKTDLLPRFLTYCISGFNCQKFGLHQRKKDPADQNKLKNSPHGKIVHWPRGGTSWKVAHQSKRTAVQKLDTVVWMWWFVLQFQDLMA